MAFRLPASNYSGGETEVPETPIDWIDISVVGDNEINLLVADTLLQTVAFQVTTLGANYSVNWGDGTISSVASAVTAQHTYTVGAGQPCSLGYTTFKIVISSASTITRFLIKRHTGVALQPQRLPILKAVFGTTGLTSGASMFYENTSLMCPMLAAVVFPATLNSITTIGQILTNCISLTFVQLPASMAVCTNADFALSGCIALKTVIMPTSWPVMASMISFVHNNTALRTITMPATMNALTTLASAYQNCKSMVSITMPTSMNALGDLNSTFSACELLQTVTMPANLRNVTITQSTFALCYNLQSIVNVDTLGHLTAQNYGGDFILNCEQLTSITYSGALRQFSASSSVVRGKLAVLRLTNTASTYLGSSPHVNVSNQNLSQSALVDLFNDLPTLVGKTINISGCTGAAALTAPERSIITSKGWTLVG